MSAMDFQNLSEFTVKKRGLLRFVPRQNIGMYCNNYVRESNHTIRTCPPLSANSLFSYT